MGFRPKIPHSDAGTRIEPLVSLPRLKWTSPAATAAAEPPEEPPAIRDRSCGFARRAIVAVFGGEAVGVGVHIEHPAEQGAGAVQLAHRPAIAGCRRPVAQQFGAGEGGVPGDIKQIFTA